METEYLRKKVNMLLGKQELLSDQIQQNKKRIRSKKRDLIQWEEAQKIVQIVAQLTQDELKYHISEVVTLALSSVFDDPYELDLDFIQKRGKTEAQISFVRGGEKIHPLSASGGGAVDVAAFALRVALWNIGRPKSRNTLILDEPGKFISSNLHDRFSKMIQEISQKLGIQIIMVSHIETLIENADKAFRVQLKGGNSYVSQEE